GGGGGSRTSGSRTGAGGPERPSDPQAHLGEPLLLEQAATEQRALGGPLRRVGGGRGAHRTTEGSGHHQRDDGGGRQGAARTQRTPHRRARSLLDVDDPGSPGKEDR